MKYVPLLEEERFQSMAAVPILSRAGETIGVIVLHTRAPHEFGEDTLKLLMHIASLASGAIENAQLYDRERRRVDTLTGLSELAQQVASAPGADELGRVLVGGTAALLSADVCQLLRVEPDGETVSCWPRSRGAAGARPHQRRRGDAGGAGEPLGARPARRGAGAVAVRDLADLLVMPLAAGGERVGVLCAAAAASGRSATRTPRSPARSRTWRRWRSSAPS